jgi:hypothetical protein
VLEQRGRSGDIPIWASRQKDDRSYPAISKNVAQTNSPEREKASCLKFPQKENLSCVLIQAPYGEDHIEGVPVRRSHINVAARRDRYHLFQYIGRRDYLPRKPNYKFERFERDRQKAEKKAARLQAKADRRKKPGDDDTGEEGSEDAVTTSAAPDAENPSTD